MTRKDETEVPGAEEIAMVTEAQDGETNYCGFECSRKFEIYIELSYINEVQNCNIEINIVLT